MAQELELIEDQFNEEARENSGTPKRAFPQCLPAELKEGVIYVRVCRKGKRTLAHGLKRSLRTRLGCWLLHFGGA